MPRPLPAAPTRAIPMLLALAVAAALLVVPAPSGAQPPAAPHALAVDALPAPVDVAPGARPQLSWQLGTPAQTAFQVQVAEVGDATPGFDAPRWDTGRVASAELRVPYGGPALDGSAAYAWRVRTWDGPGRPTAWSAPARFGTGPASWEGAEPIWLPREVRGWRDFDLHARFTVEQVAASILFRAESGDRYYMWQLRAADRPQGGNALAPHTNVGGSFTELDSVPLGEELVPGTAHDLRISVRGTTITTWLDDREIDRRDDATFAAGGIGFRNGSTEASLWDSISVTAPDGTTLYADDFEDGTSDFRCGTVADGQLRVGTSTSCTTGTAWSDYTLEADVTIQQTTAGMVLRARDGSNYYLWQLKAGNPGTLEPHVRVDGAFTRLKQVDLGRPITAGTSYALRIEAVGSTIRTWLDGELVDTTTDTRFADGSIGVRVGGFESFTLHGLRATSSTGEVLYEEDFADAAPGPHPDLPCGVVDQPGAVRIPNNADCRLVEASTDWAFLRDEVVLRDVPIAWAHLHATGSSPTPSKQHVYKLWLDGAFVGLGPTQPLADEVRYDGFDVTDLLRPGGTHALGALAYTTADQRFLARLVVTYADGVTEVHGTGPSWRVLNGRHAYPAAGSTGTGYYAAPVENIQAAAFPSGFDRPGFDDSGWEQAAVRPAFPDLLPTPTAEVGQQLHLPASATETSPGTYVLDYGRTWVGGLSLDVDGTAGQQLDIRFGEELNPDGTVRHQLRTGNTFRDVWTLREGPQHLETFGMRVFRYVEVRGAAPGLEAADFPALALVYPFEDPGTFASSDPDLDAVWQLSRNTIEALDQSLYVDTWTRERINYEADAYLHLRSHLHLSADPTLGQYSMDYFQQRRTWPTEWPMYVILGVHEAWQHTGDLRLAEGAWDSLVAKLPTQWIDPVTGLIRKDSGSDGCNSRTDCDIVDWPASERDGYVFTRYNTVINAIAYRAFADMAAMAEALGRTDEAASYGATAERLRDAMNELLWDDVAGAYRDGLEGAALAHHAVHATVFATAFGVPEPGEQAQRAADSIAERGIVCSVYCAAFLIQSLYDGGRGDEALALLTSEGERSWLHMIAQGAGATMEAWSPRLKPNTTFSHPWAASPAFNLPSGLLGIRPTSPGYATVDIAPQPGALDWATGTTPTVRGTIGVTVDTTAGTAVGISIPGGVTADVRLPADAGDGAAADPVLFVDGEPVDAVAEDGHLVLAGVGAGCRVISTTPQPAAEVADRLAAICTAPADPGPGPGGPGGPGTPGGPGGPPPTTPPTEPPGQPTTPPAEEPSVEVRSGASRVETAVAISRSAFPEDGSADAVVLARADVPFDALAATPLSPAEGGPLLLTSSDQLHPATLAEVQRVLADGGTVWLVGGEAALGAGVAAALADAGLAVQRLAGETRYETALAVAERIGDPDAVLVASGEAFPDALSAGAAAAAAGGLVLLTPDGAAHPAVGAYLAERPGTPAYAVGGPAATAFPDAEPLVGAGREATAVAVAEAFFDAPALVGLARGDEFADALTGGAHAALRGGPVLLTPSDLLHPAVEGYACGLDGVDGVVYGGPSAITGQVVDALADRLAGRGCPG